MNSTFLSRIVIQISRPVCQIIRIKRSQDTVSVTYKSGLCVKYLRTTKKAVIYLGVVLAQCFAISQHVLSLSSSS